MKTCDNTRNSRYSPFIVRFLHMPRIIRFMCPRRRCNCIGFDNEARAGSPAICMSNWNSIASSRHTCSIVVKAPGGGTSCRRSCVIA